MAAGAKGSKAKQRKRGSASGRTRKASAAANRKSRNPDERESTLEARVRRRPGIRANEAEGAAGGYRKGGDFPAGQRPPRKIRRHGKNT